MLMTSKRTPDSLSEIDVVHQVHDSLELPDGFRAEIIEGQIAVAASPFAQHAFIVWYLKEMTQKALPPGFGLFEVTTAQEPGGDRYIPDLVAWPIELIKGRRKDWVLSTTECEFVVEVTSPDQQKRDYKKASGYARGEVGTYLLVDQSRRVCVVYTDPENGEYKTLREIPFGAPLELTLHTTVTIDTSDF